MSNEMVTLKNGAIVGKLFLEVIMRLLRSLAYKDAITFMSFVRYCRDEKHVIRPNHVAVLKAFALLQDDARVSHQIRDIVLSAVINANVEMEIVDPVKSA